MYKFHYDIVQPKFGPENVRLLYMDTGSFFYQIYTEDLYQDFADVNFKQHLDTSAYPEDHVLFSNDNKKELGKFKDELYGKLLEKCIGIASKLYTYKVYGGKIVKKAKGVKKTCDRTSNHICRL